MNYLKIISEKLQNKQNIFLTGGAGVGKTTITKNIIELYEEDAKRVRDSLKNSFPNFRVEIFDLDNVGFRIEKGLKSSI